MKKVKLQIDNISIRVDKDQNCLKELIFKQYQVNILNLKILKKSLDARKKSEIVFRYRVMIEVNEDDAEKISVDKNVTFYTERQYQPVKRAKRDKKVVIIGSGPAGIFSALRLIEAGVRIVLLEQGKKVEERALDIEKLKKEGLLNTESNFLFGEGGAGTWSDGKLTTRINKPEIDWIYKQLVKFGAPEGILYEAKPHIGSDILVKIMKNIREFIIKSGSDIFFEEKVTDLVIKDYKVYGVLSKNNEYLGDAVIAATGHSARDFYKLIDNKAIKLEQKGFAVGVRIEHPAEIINKIQYGKYASFLGAADYRLVYNDKTSKRAVYSFCMCPGGEVINSSSEKRALCTNGMSYSKRSAPFSNAALVVSVWPDDLPEGPLAGNFFQREIEKAAFSQGGGSFYAPAQSAEFFLKNRIDKRLPDSSYLPGVVPGNINDLFPEKFSLLLKKGLVKFDKVMPGFIKYGLLIGVETRTSSPVRIVRRKDMQSVSVKDFYPVGEGAGYAGGIISSAVDGIKAASKIIDNCMQ